MESCIAFLLLLLLQKIETTSMQTGKSYVRSTVCVYVYTFLCAWIKNTHICI